jgi:RNA polymerase sigma factor (sigma-70 family)
VTEPRCLVERAKAGDAAAFADLVRRYDAWATGWAIALLGDYQLAQDAVQEAFAAAHASLPTLAEPEAFPGWLKAIVRHTCFRALRQRRPDLVPLDFADHLPSAQPDPGLLVEEDERRYEVLAALTTLPEAQRQVVLLHYWQEYSHREIAALLGIPATKVNNRLHAARVRLREEMLAMTENVKPTGPAAPTGSAPTSAAVAMHGRVAPESPAGVVPTGTIVAVHGPVVDVHFAYNRLPALRSWLVPTTGAKSGRPLLAVVQYLHDGVARAVAVSNGASLKQGLEVSDAGEEVAVPIEPRNAREAVARIARLARGPSHGASRLETGMKALDLFCPFVDGDVVGFVARPGVGQIVLIQELLYRRATRPGRLTVIAAVPAINRSSTTEDPYGIGEVQTAYLPVRDMAATPARFFDSVDVTIALSLPLARLGMWPAVDPSGSSSKHLDTTVVGAEHAEIAARARDLLRPFPPEQESTEGEQPRSSEHRILVARARRLRRFLSQPMYVAGPWIRWPAAFVPLADTLRGCRAILDGAYDQLPEEAFYMANTIEEVVERAHTSST